MRRKIFEVNESGATAHKIVSKAREKNELIPLYAEIAAIDKGAMLLHIDGAHMQIKTSCDSVNDLASKRDCEVVQTMGD